METSVRETEWIEKKPRRQFAVPLPDRMRALAVDHRGFPVPWFVAWFVDGRPAEYGEGVPDFRVIDTPKLGRAVRDRLCWVCGQKLGGNLAFVIGPMCAINRTISEPPSHLECARFSARVCPFLSQPKMRRNEKGLPEHVPAPGEGLLRNPGVACVWVTRSYKPFKVPANMGRRGTLFELGEPTAVEWWCEGRPATNADVVASISSGFPALVSTAEKQGLAALRELGRFAERAIPLLPAA